MPVKTTTQKGKATATPAVHSNPSAATAFRLEDLYAYKGSGYPNQYETPAAIRFWSGKGDDVHGAVLHLLRTTQHSLALNMYGYDDEEFDTVIRGLIDAGVPVQVSLDRSQAAGQHESKLLAAWTPHEKLDVAIGDSVHRAISHLKMAIVDGKYLVSGSTNWSASGESLQDNECLIAYDPLQCAEARSILDINHRAMQQQMQGQSGGTATPTTPKTAKAATPVIRPLR